MRNTDEEVRADALWFCAVMVIVVAAAFFIGASCAPYKPQPAIPCNESVEPIGFGFGARCAPGALMAYRNVAEAGILADEANPWAGGYIVCHCP